MTASDGTNTTAKTITVNLTDVNDTAPVITDRGHAVGGRERNRSSRP